MEKSLESVKRNFGTVRTGRANTAILDRIMVDYYGVSTPLKKMANASTPDAQTITIQPFDKTCVFAAVGSEWHRIDWVELMLSCPFLAAQEHQGH
jgi:ribosome recycling factor